MMKTAVAWHTKIRGTIHLEFLEAWGKALQQAESVKFELYIPTLINKVITPH